VRAETDTEQQRRDPISFPEESLIVSMAGLYLPLAMVVEATERAITVSLGSWLPEVPTESTTSILRQRKGVLESCLRSLYAQIELSDWVLPTARYELSGMAIGIPTTPVPNPLDSLPWDRLVQGLAGLRWRVTILAQPVGDETALDLRRSLAEDMRQAESEAVANLTAKPLAEHYQKLLKHMMEGISLGIAGGVWRTAVYLEGDDLSYHRLAALWQGAFSGDAPTDILDVWDSATVGQLADHWAMPDDPGLPGPGFFKRPVRYQSMLSSRQLGAYMHLPRFECPGVSVSRTYRFDVVPPSDSALGGPMIRIGRIRGFSNSQSDQFRKPFGQIWLTHEQALGTSEGEGLELIPTYDLTSKSLVRHTFVAGATGAGKTNTIHVLLEQLTKQGIPFLVLEPAKTEYRKLVRSLDNVTVFTPGNENINPLRLNPFEPVGNTPVSVHIDLLRSAFSAAFGMWTPLPQLVERCLHEIYEDRGWDATSNENPRLDASSQTELAWPTLDDLIEKVDEVTPRLGYEQKIASDLRAALQTRLMALNAGGKGKLLNCTDSTAPATLFGRRVVVELEHIGDDDDKALIMGFFVIRLVEYRRGFEPPIGEELRHLLVIEEAHRLLSSGNRSSSGEEGGDSRGRAVESFVNLLAEIRSYGQGVMIVDQVPTKLHSDVIKNTNLKIAHRLVAADDRAVMGSSMSLSDKQASELARLGPGDALVYSHLDDFPIRVVVPPANSAEIASLTTHELAKMRSTLIPRPKPSENICDRLAGRTATNRAFVTEFSRFVLSMAENPRSVPLLWSNLRRRTRELTQPRVVPEELSRRTLEYAIWNFVQDHGRKGQWLYSETDLLRKSLSEVFRQLLNGNDATESVSHFCHQWTELHRTEEQPFIACRTICVEQNSCRYRTAVDKALGMEFATHSRALRQAMRANSNEQTVYLEDAWSLCRAFSSSLILVDEQLKPALTRVGLCYAQQLLASDLSEIQRAAMAALVRASGDAAIEQEK
jgi:hypothetical protein